MLSCIFKKDKWTNIQMSLQVFDMSLDASNNIVSEETLPDVSSRTATQPYVLATVLDLVQKSSVIQHYITASCMYKTFVIQMHYL